MDTRYSSNNEMALTQRDIIRDKYFRTSYTTDFTKKKLNKNQGHGLVNAFTVGDMTNPKMSLKRDEINANYIRKNQAVISKYKTGITTYQYDYCGMKPKKNLRARSIGLNYY